MLFSLVQRVPRRKHEVIPLIFFTIKEKPPFPLGKGELRHHKNRSDSKGDSPQEISIFKTMYWLPYNKNLKEFSRKLRNNSTLGEILLWQKLRAGSLRNYKFNRQKPLGRYIVDFYCKPLNLVIEVDGIYHFEEDQKLKDENRQEILEKMNLSFLRFSEQQVRKDMGFVIKEIETYMIKHENSLSLTNN